VGEIPDCDGKASGVILWRMKIKQKIELTLGGLIAAAYQAWGAGLAEKIVRLMTKARLAVFREPPFFLISYAKGGSV